MKKLFFLSALLIAGCVDFDDGSNGNTLPAPDPGISQLATGTWGNYQNVGDEYIVVRTREAYTFLFCWTTQMTNYPAVDFITDIVFASILGYRPTAGYTVANTSATFNAGTATVNVTETFSGGFVAQVITHPYAFSSLADSANVEVVKDGIPAGAAMELTFDELVNDHFLTVVDPQNTIAPAAHQAALENNECPFDNSDQLFTAVLNVNLSGMDVSNIAYYCADHSWYWVRHEQTAFVGTIVQWLGPFRP